MFLYYISLSLSQTLDGDIGVKTPGPPGGAGSRPKTPLRGGARPEPESYQLSSQASSEDTTNPEENWEQTQHISDEGGQPSFRS